MAAGSEVFQRLQAAAQAGQVDAQNALGDFYWQQGDGLEERRLAVSWYSRAAGAGHAEAQFSLGFSLWTGDGVVADREEALRWFQAASEAGQVGAQYFLGLALLQGTEGTPKDPLRGARWLAEAAWAGLDTAQCLLGDLCRQGQGVEQSHFEAYRWYLAAAEQGNIQAQYLLGRMCQEGWPWISQPSAKAYRWFCKAGRLGHVDACFQAGMACLRGDGAPKNRSRAAQWLQRAASGQHAEAQWRLGVLFQEGLPGRDPEMLLALALFGESARQGHADGQFQLGRTLLLGVGVAAVPAKALPWLRQAAEQGSPQHQSPLGAWLLSGVAGDDADLLAEGISWLRQAERSGSPAEACFQLGEASREGRGLAMSSGQAMAYYRRAAELGHALAQCRLGTMLVSDGAEPRNAIEAAHWFRLSALQGCGEAQAALAELLATGAGIPRDAVEAYAWGRLAAANGVAVSRLMGSGLDSSQKRLGQRRLCELRDQVGAVAKGSADGPERMPAGASRSPYRPWRPSQAGEAAIPGGTLLLPD